jgi:hypothetical protein
MDPPDDLACTCDAYGIFAIEMADIERGESFGISLSNPCQARRPLTPLANYRFGTVFQMLTF